MVLFALRAYVAVPCSLMHASALLLLLPAGVFSPAPEGVSRVLLFWPFVAWSLVAARPTC